MLLISISAEIDSDEAAPRCPVRNLFLTIFFAKLIRKHLCGSLFLVNLQAFSLKETPAQKFSCRFLQILKEHVNLKNQSGWLLLGIQHRLIAIKIQIVFGPWKLTLEKVLFFFRMLLFSFLFLLYLRTKSYMNIKSLENLEHLQIRERLVRLYRNVSKSFFKSCGFLLFS